MDGAFPSQKGESFDAMSGGPGGFGQRGQRRGFRGTAENAKTKLCNRWLHGDCRFGDRCNFAHGEDELRKLPPREENGGNGGTGGRFGPTGGPGGRGGKAPGAYNYPPRGGMQGGYRPTGRGMGGYDEYPGGYGGNYPTGYANAAPGGYNQGMDRGYGGPGGGFGPVGGVPMPGGAGPRGPAPGMTEDVWAAQGYPVPGPNNWVEYRVKETGEPYYHNHKTNVTSWERPPEWTGAQGHQQM